MKVLVSDTLSEVGLKIFREAKTLSLITRKAFPRRN
jgi:hypothetical protein